MAHMITSSVPSNRDLRRSESVRPAKLNTRSACTSRRNIQELTSHDSNTRKTSSSLHQTRTSTSCVMSDPSSFLPITALLWITGIAFPAQEIRSCTTNDNNQTSYKVTSTRGRREAYLLCARKHGDASCIHGDASCIHVDAS